MMLCCIVNLVLFITSKISLNKILILESGLFAPPSRDICEPWASALFPLPIIGFFNKYPAPFLSLGNTMYSINYLNYLFFLLVECTVQHKCLIKSNKHFN